MARYPGDAWLAHSIGFNWTRSRHARPARGIRRSRQLHDRTRCALAAAAGGRRPATVAAHRRVGPRVYRPARLAQAQALVRRTRPPRPRTCRTVAGARTRRLRFERNAGRATSGRSRMARGYFQESRYVARHDRLGGTLE